MRAERPVNPLPAVIVAVFVPLAAVELILSFGSYGIVGGPTAIGWRLGAVQSHAFSPIVWDEVAGRGNLSLDLLKRFVTYAFVHQSFTHALFGGALFLAMGKFVGDVFSAMNLALLLILTTVGSALVFGVLFSGPVPLFGIYPAVYGLIGAYTYLFWTRLGALGQNQLTAFRLIAFLLGIQLVFGVIFGSGPQWVAEVAGFAIGFAASLLLAPGGWEAFLARARQR